MKNSNKNIIEQFRRDERSIRMKKVQSTNVHIAVLVKKGKIICEARNQLGTRSRGSGFSEYSIHAERNIIKKLGDYNKLRGCDLYVIRIGSGNQINEFANSKPCNNCQCFLNKCFREYGLKRVYYTV